MQSRWLYFTKEELSCHGSCSRCAGTDNNMNPEFMNKVVKLRKLCNFPLKVRSGYRCPDRNKEVSKTGLNGPHTTGKAIDVLISGPEAYLLVLLAMELNFTGVGIHQKGPVGKRHIHLDSGIPGKKRPKIWTY
jgi:uncharacterized protein YcbK (DUF882 family)|tara:strand:+ start:543 stop:941 length:399 start_codon:yes stop_codon:yes gene_type:complete